MRLTVSIVVLFVLSAMAEPSRAGVNYEEEPIRYSEAQADDAVSRLQADLDSGKMSLKRSGETGYLEAILDALQVSKVSQTLVFSKTSLQADKIGPRQPRANYFNDEVHVGYVRGGLVELAAADPLLGMVFYTFDPDDSPPRFERQRNRCLNCHASSRTGNVPGVLVRSVFPDPKGQPVIAAGSFVTSPRSPLEQRWGGWYVTGESGDQKHLGNFQLPDSRKPKEISNTSGQNVLDLADRCEIGHYLAPSSDIVALMVLEHQTAFYNALTRATFLTRLRDWTREKKELDMSLPPIQAELDAATESLVQQILFSDEAKLASPIRGTSSFAADFPGTGPRTAAGLSLKELDLQTRVFRHPCCYLILARPFQRTPSSLRMAIYRKLGAILSSPEQPAGFTHLTTESRGTLRAVLTELVPEFAIATAPEN